MIRFLEDEPIRFNWASHISKKLYESIEDVIDEGGERQKVYMNIAPNLYTEVLMMDAKSVKVVDEDSPMNGLKIYGKIEIFGEIVGKFEKVGHNMKY